MKNKELAFDRTTHILYSKHAEKLIRAQLRRDYGAAQADELWEKVQLQYAEYLKDAPDMGGKSNAHAMGIYDGHLVFAYYTVLPVKPTIEHLQALTDEIFMSSLRTLGKLFNMNSGWQLRLLSKIFQKVGAADKATETRYPESFHMVNEPFDAKNGVIQYCFTRCPHADFAKAHGLEHIMPALCNCDYVGMAYLHAGLIRRGTLMHGDCCDYCIVGDKNPLLRHHPCVTDENGFWVNN